MQLQSTVSYIVLAVGLPVLSASAPVAAGSRAGWLRVAHWGVMVHFLPDWIDPQRDWTPGDWNETVAGFDAEALAQQLREVGAGYCLLSIGQSSGFYLAPNEVYDRLVAARPSKCSQRDLVADLSRALQKRDLRLLVYLPAGPPGKDRRAQQALAWQGDGQPNREFQRNWEQVIRAWSMRWGGSVSGWWFDGCGRPNIMYRSPDPPNFTSFAAAARAGNSGSIVAFSPGLYYPIFSATPEDDYTAGLIYDFERDFVSRGRLADGTLDGVQLHVLSFLGSTWGRGEPRFPAEKVAAYTRKVAEYGGALTWDVPVQRNGVIDAAFLEQLKAAGRVLHPPASPENPGSTPRP